MYPLEPCLHSRVSLLESCHVSNWVMSPPLGPCLPLSDISTRQVRSPLESCLYTSHVSTIVMSSPGSCLLPDHVYSRISTSHASTRVKSPLESGLHWGHIFTRFMSPLESCLHKSYISLEYILPRFLPYPVATRAPSLKAPSVSCAGPNTVTKYICTVFCPIQPRELDK